MTLGRRLFLTGAVLPTCVTAVVFFLADRTVHRALEAQLDQALLAQAAVETVSLFDGPHAGPHLHMARSPLVESVRPFAPEGALFGPDGALVLRYPPPLDEPPPQTRAPGRVGAAPTLETVTHANARLRELAVTVASPEGAPYTLVLSAPLTHVEGAAGAVHQTLLGASVTVGLLLLALQWLLARRLVARLDVLRRHLEAVRTGDLSPLPLAGDGDELGTLHDVLATATERLRQAQAAQERLLADAAHELRTPLTRMRMALDLALRRPRTSQEWQETLTETREEVKRLAELATRLLDAATLGKATELAEADVAALVQEAIAALAGEAQTRQVTVAVRGAAAAPLQVHAPSVRQALDNLLHNALRFAPAHSTVTVELRPQAKGLQLRVSDDGPGIAEAEREAVFEPFHRGRGTTGPGAGLGLTIVREIARRHGGTAFVAPPDQRGATVVLELGVAAPSGGEGQV